MRLSTDPDRDEERALATLRAAREAGVRLFDTAAAYGRNAREHHGERLLARAFGAGLGELEVVTKAGMARPKGGWRPDGRRKTILADAEASRRALGVEALDLLLLHAPDPRVPFATSVRALATLLERGVAEAVGLSNVRLDQLEEARAIVPIDCVQVALSPFDEDAVRGGVVERCFELGIRVLAHSPLGGPKRRGVLARHEDLAYLAGAHGVTAETIALAWLAGLHPSLVPLPGARRPETARLAGAAATLALRDDERALLDALFPIGELVRTRRAERRATRPRSEREVVLFVGMPAAGKTEAARHEGGLRLSRDERGGTLKDLARAMEAELEDGARKVVMDATYPTRAQRNRVLEAAWRQGARVRAVWFDTPLAQAQLNAVDRMLAKAGRVLDPDALKKAGRADPTMIPPAAQLRFARTFEPPREDEGFDGIERRAFERRPRPDHREAGLVIDAALLEEAEDEAGWLSRLAERTPRTALLVTAWWPDLGAAERGAREGALAHRIARLGAELAVCPHAAGPPRCWCRPPLPGLVLPWMRRERIAPEKLTLVGGGLAPLADALGALSLPRLR